MAKRFEIVQFLLFFTLSAEAQTQSPSQFLTLNEILESANRFYPLMIAARQEIQKAEGESLTAQGGFDPVFKTTSYNTPVGYYNNNYLNVSLEQPTPFWGTLIYGGWRTGQGNFAQYDGKMATFNGGEIQGGLDIPILRNGAIDERRAKIQSTQKGVEVAATSLALKKIEITRIATHRYWDWVASGKKLEIATELLDRAEVRDRALLHRVKQGDAPLIEQTENQRAVIQRQSALLAAERSLQKSTLELSLYFRDSDGNPKLASPSQLPHRFPEPDKNEIKNLDSVIQSAITRHPELKRLEIQLEQTQIDIKVSENQLLPKLDFHFGISQDLGSPMNPTHDSAYSLYDLANYPTEMKVSAVLEIPLFFRSSRGKLNSAKASYGKIEAQETLARQKIQTTITDALQAMQASAKRAVLARKELELARKLEDGERIRFQHGDSTLLLVNIREQITGDAAIREVDAQVEYFHAKADYQASIISL